MDTTAIIQGKVIAARPVVVEYCQIGELADRYGWPLDFSYSANFASLRPKQLCTAETILSLVEFDGDLGGKGNILVLQLRDSLKELGLGRANVWQLLAIASQAPDLVPPDQRILAAHSLDFPHDPQFPREYFPYIAHRDNSVQPDMIQEHEHRVYRKGTIFLAQPGTGQPELLLR